MSTLDLRLARSAHLNQVCVGILRNGSLDSIGDARDRLTVKATDYVAELHRSQLFLLTDKQYGSAAAMMRLVMEGALSALYILHLKDEANAIQLEDGKTFFPSAGRMFARCSKLPIIGANIETIGKSQGPFRKFTHGDMPQINRRHSPGDWTGTFDEREIATFRSSRTSCCWASWTPTPMRLPILCFKKASERCATRTLPRRERSACLFHKTTRSALLPFDPGKRAPRPVPRGRFRANRASSAPIR